MPRRDVDDRGVVLALTCDDSLGLVAQHLDVSAVYKFFGEKVLPPAFYELVKAPPTKGRLCL